MSWKPWRGKCFQGFPITPRGWVRRYTFTCHENPEGENVLPSEGTNNRDPPHTVQRYNEQWTEKTFFICVGTCFSSRFTPQLLSLNILFFVTFCGEGKAFVLKGSFGFLSFCWSFWLPSVFVKGEFFGSSRFCGEGEILTLVADQGHSFSPLFVFIL